MEQPTLFYALVVYSYLAGQQNAVNLALAWGYVAIRVVHSLVQATVNVVLVRFSIFSRRLAGAGACSGGARRLGAVRLIQPSRRPPRP